LVEEEEEEEEGITGQGEEEKMRRCQLMDASGSSRLSIATWVAPVAEMDGGKSGNTSRQTGKKQAGANYQHTVGSK
jgi:hypothetical protein